MPVRRRRKRFFSGIGSATGECAVAAGLAALSRRRVWTDMFGCGAAGGFGGARRSAVALSLCGASILASPVEKSRGPALPSVFLVPFPRENEETHVVALGEKSEKWLSSFFPSRFRVQLSTRFFAL